MLTKLILKNPFFNYTMKRMIQNLTDLTEFDGFNGQRKTILGTVKKKIF